MVIKEIINEQRFRSATHLHDWSRLRCPSEEVRPMGLIEPLRKQAYSNILENLPAKYEKFQIKILIFFLCLLKNIDCEYSLEPPRRGGSN